MKGKSDMTNVVQMCWDLGLREPLEERENACVWGGLGGEGENC